MKYFYGKSGNDTISGSNGPDYIQGYGGNDTLYGLAGNDYVMGDNGNDYISGGAGNDYLYGEDGNDKIYGGDGSDTIYDGAGKDFIKGGSGNDVFIMSTDPHHDIVYGQSGDDYFAAAGTGFDYLDGGDGNDTFVLAGSGKVIAEFVGGSGRQDYQLYVGGNLQPASAEITIDDYKPGYDTLDIHDAAGRNTDAIINMFDVNKDHKLTAADGYAQYRADGTSYHIYVDNQTGKVIGMDLQVKAIVLHLPHSDGIFF